MTIDLDATVAILRHAEPAKLDKLAKLLLNPTEERDVLSVAVDAALEAGPIATRYGFRGKGARTHTQILGNYGGSKISYQSQIQCFEGDRLIARGDARAIARRWLADVAEQICSRLDERDARALAAIAAARRYIEGEDASALEHARGDASAAAFEPNLPPASVAARTAALNTTHEDAWEAAWYTATCAAGWLDRPLTHLVERLGLVDDHHLSPAMVVILEAHWAKLNVDLAERVIAALR